jgi:hypothetical protein
MRPPLLDALCKWFATCSSLRQFPTLRFLGAFVCVGLQYRYGMSGGCPLSHVTEIFEWTKFQIASYGRQQH